MLGLLGEIYPQQISQMGTEMMQRSTKLFFLCKPLCSLCNRYLVASITTAHQSVYSPMTYPIVYPGDPWHPRSRAFATRSDHHHR